MKTNKQKIKPAGVKRNDLTGSFRVRRNKIYAKYKGIEITTGFENTPNGWKAQEQASKVLRRAEHRLDIKTQERDFHGFRRAFADRLFEKKFEIVEVQEIMRHKDIKTTLEYYKSYQQAKLINKMNENLK
jgi:integrase